MKITPSAPMARIGAMAMAFLLGVYGFGEAYQRLRGHPGSLGTNAFHALQLIVGKFPSELDDADLPLSLEVARWALPLLTLWTSIALAWRQVRNPVQLRLATRRGEHLVIAGGAGLAQGIAAAERDAKRAALLWTDDGAADWAMALGDRGVASTPTEGERHGVAALGLAKARGVLLLCDDQTRNIALSSAAIDEARAVRPPGDPLPVLARIDDLELRRSIEERHARMGDQRAARMRVLSLPDIAARGLFLDRPIDRFVRIGDPDRLILFLGFTPTAERLLVRYAAGGHYRDGRSLRFLILAPDAAAQEAALRARRPGLAAFDVRFETGSVDQPSLVASALDAAMRDHGAPTAIVVDIGDEARALAVAYAVEGVFADRGLVSPPVHVRTAPCGDDQLGYAIFPFGGEAAMADPDLLLQDRHDRLARAIHDSYVEGRLSEGDRIGARATMREWEELPESFRDDNRLVADTYRLKLRDIGARLAASDDARGFRLDADEVEDLSRAEHGRWMGARLIDGWTLGPRDDTAKRHPDIIPYDDLSERIRDLDREQVRMMTRLLPATGQAPRRLLTVEVRAGAGGTPLETILARLATDFPDRALALAGWFDDPDARALLVAAAGRGAAVVWLLAANPLPTIEALPHDVRGATLRALRGADTVVAADPSREGAAAWLAARAPRVLTVAPDGSVAAPWAA